jgi:hypothetical protein
MLNPLETDQMKFEFGEKDAFSFNELFDFWQLNDRTSSRATGHWRIHTLKKQGILQEIKSGWYTLKVRPVYTPSPDKRQLAVEKIIQQKYHLLTYCTWNLNWLNEFSVHQFPVDNTIVEVEKELVESMIGLLEDNGYTNLGWAVSQHRMQLTGVKNPIYVLPLPSRAPVARLPYERFDLSIPTLEKLLVDLYNDLPLFHYLQGTELQRIFSHAIDHYAINYTTLFAYAKRRYKDIAVKEFLHTHFPNLPSIIYQ